MDKSALNALIDGDFLPYRAGFAADTQAKEAYGLDEYLQYDYLNWALANVKTSLTYLLEEVFAKAEWHKLYISGQGNYRNTIATTLPRLHAGWTYKGNRDALHKPKYFAEIRDYMIAVWGAVPVNGIETDDMVSIEQYANPDRSTCIVSQDKDLANSPGWNYNPVKKEFQYITLRQANLNWRKQVLQGDRSDNIPGLEGIGDVRAAKLLEQCEYRTDLIDKETFKLYKNQYGPDAQGAYTDNQNLLWIMRESGKGFDGRKLEIV